MSRLGKRAEEPPVAREVAVAEELLVGALVCGGCQAVSKLLVLEEVAEGGAERVEISGVVDQ